MKVAIITGAGSGIGLATAKQMHEMGMAIVGVGRSQNKLDTLVSELDNSDRVATLSVDITAADAPQKIVDFALERFGEINFLVNNAGIGAPKPLHETDDETLDYFLDIMLRAPFRLCREVIGHMKDGDAIVNITSTYAVIGGRRGGAYSAAKGGLASLTEHMACEYGPLGIRSNCVAPGVTMTDMVKERMNDKAFRRTNIETTPFPRLGTVEEVAGTIAFLCSPAAGAINGQQVVVDCGWTSTKYLSQSVLDLD
ncbi:SDR family oxidoreductase [Aestuariicella hydrocarbonica]|uniref:SDR family oxidoreductase n=1 Tax=Pseudomaricurvus hydrocarbonicus TaxID=1470433 RepID=A0A9E5JV09_9GAMM|nr:SDR family oxidoreductase [Aestuariicella hydrocarbonica]NHO65971.1 SDR family oxidoreductase [Aestuariicella hydrocarbonica]